MRERGVLRRGGGCWGYEEDKFMGESSGLGLFINRVFLSVERERESVVRER